MIHMINCAVCAFCITFHYISYSFFSICVKETQILIIITELICQACNASLMKLLLQY